MVSGLVYSTMGKHSKALEELRTAIRLNPSFALAHTMLGLGCIRGGLFAEAIEETNKALKMSPVDSFSGMYTAFHGLALFGARRFSEAAAFLRAATAAYPEFPGHYNALISCCGHLGLLAEANEFLVYRNRIGPPLTISLQRRNLSQFMHWPSFQEGLQKAGIPEE